MVYNNGTAEDPDWQDEGRLQDILGKSKQTLTYEYSSDLTITDNQIIADTVENAVLKFNDAGTLSYERNNDSLIVTNTTSEGDTQKFTIANYFKDTDHAEYAEKLHVIHASEAVADANVVETILTTTPITELVTNKISDTYNDVYTATADVTFNGGNKTITTAGGITIDSKSESGNDDYTVTSVTSKTVIKDAGGDDSLQINSANNLYYLFDVAKDVSVSDDTAYDLDGKLYITSDFDNYSTKGVQIDKYLAGWTAQTVVEETTTDATTVTASGKIETLTVADAQGKNAAASMFGVSAEQTIRTAVNNALVAANTSLDEKGTYNTAFELLAATGKDWDSADVTKLTAAKENIKNAYKSAIVGTNADNTFKAELANQTFYAGSGSDTFEFAAGTISKGEGSAVIVSKTDESTTKVESDTLKITGADDITVSELWDDGTLQTSDVTFTVTHDEKFKSGTVEITTTVSETITYKWDDSDTTKSIVINDVKADTTKTLTIAAPTADYEFKAGTGNNDVNISADSNKVDIVSNTSGTNSYKVAGTGDNSFEYKGANDTYTSFGESNDAYTIKVSALDSKLVINDNDGEDALTFTDINYDDLRYFFNIKLTYDAEAAEGSRYTASVDADTTLKIVTSDSMSGVASVRKLTGSDYNGVEIADGVTSASACAIETIKAYKGTVEGVKQYQNITFASYVNQIVQNVQSWANASGIADLTDTNSVFETGKAADARDLLEAYNVSYTVAG